MTPDQVELLRSDIVVSDEAKQAGRTLHAFGIDATPMETVVPSYLWRFRKTGQFAVGQRTTDHGRQTDIQNMP